MNPPTVVALIIVALIVIGLIVLMIVNKKKGKTSCSCGCSNCAFKDSCHTNGKALKASDASKGNDAELTDTPNEADNN
ncbi:MAG: FeoB-associated Cys-rich membrane protein [Clostridia bacterium]|nr:FeoB-associated Cys-rich membrane protein [Clostridia bacterium]